MAPLRREAGDLRGGERPRTRGGAALVGVAAPGCRGAGGGEDLAIPAARRRRQARPLLSWRRDQVRAMVKVMALRWSLLPVCVAHLGIVAGVGCSARALDP